MIITMSTIMMNTTTMKCIIKKFSLLEAFYPKEIIVRTASKSFALIDYPSEVYGNPDTRNY